MFSERLKRLRMEKGITQKELADRLHISRSTIAGYESLGKEPDGEKLCALADFLGCPLIIFSAVRTAASL